MLEACQALAAQASVDLAVLVLAAPDSVDPDSVDLVVLVAAHPALVALALVALAALAALAVRASVDLSVHVVLISKSGSIPLGSEVLHDAHRVDPQGSEGRASIF